MSSHDRDIIWELSSHLTSTDREILERIIRVMTLHRPKVDIDPIYKKNLRKELLTAYILTEKKFQFTLPRISFAWIRISGTLMASFFIGIFLWKVYSVPPQMAPIQEISLEPSIQMDMSEPSPSWAPISSATPSVSDPEVKKPQAKIQEISPEKMSNPETLESIDTTLIELDTVITPEVSNLADPVYSDLWASTDTMPMMMRAMAPVIMIPSYPVNITIYVKQSGSFTADEIQSLTGTDIVSSSARTEQNLTLLQSRIEQKLWANTINGEWQIIYREMTKRGSPDVLSRYLIPSIRYTLTGGGEIFVPIVLGYE